MMRSNMSQQQTGRSCHGRCVRNLRANRLSRTRPQLMPCVVRAHTHGGSHATNQQSGRGDLHRRQGAPDQVLRGHDRGLPIRASDDSVTVLASEHFELVIHASPGEPPGHTSPARQDVYVKPFFPVVSLAEARETAAILGGSLRPEHEEWEARGFRAWEAVDPDGNVIQLRQDAH